MKNFLGATLILKVTLCESHPKIWRKISTPADFDFYQLHMAIQAAFGWENCHLFQFGDEGLASGSGIGIPSEDDPVSDARKVKLKKVLRKPGDTLMYVYDFGDNWRHMIELEAINNEEVHAAICEAGENECPPEDVGGIDGYLQMLAVFQSGTTTKRKEYRDWLGLSSNETWNASYYNQREINKRMALLTPRA